MSPSRARIGGHLWTLGPYLRDQLRPPVEPPSEAWEGTVDDPQVGVVRLRGRLAAPPAASRAVILLHGLGGGLDSRYVWRMAAAVDAAGWASLRLLLRGADGSGEDIYHAGLTADVHAALASPALAGFERIDLLGFSLGGHLALRTAIESSDRRLRAAVAVCPPIDLAPAVAAIDRPSGWAYRQNILQGLRGCYRPIADRGRAPTPYERVRRVRRIREWDTLTVVPRHGFDGPDDYYAKASVGPMLAALERPALVVAALGDPIIPAATVWPWLRRASDRLEVRWLRRAGHVGFPGRMELGQDAAPGLEPQVVAWLAAT